MQDKPATSVMLRTTLAALDRLCEASLGLLRLRWEASPLGYDPLAGLAESLSGRCDRLLQSAVDRLLEPAGEPGAVEPQPRNEKRLAGSAERWPQGSIRRDAGSMPGRIEAADIALKAGRAGGSETRRSDRADVRDVRTPSGPNSEVLPGDIAAAVARILARHPRPAAAGEDAGEAMDSAALVQQRTSAATSREPLGRANSVVQAKSDSVAGSYGRRRGLARSPAGSDESKQIRYAYRDEVGAVAGVRKSDSRPNGRGLGSGPPPGAGAANGDIRSVLGKTPMSRSGLSSPIAFDHTVAADRLSSWAYGAGRLPLPVPHSQGRSPKPTHHAAVVFERDSTGRRMTRSEAGIDGDPARFIESDLPAAHSGPLGRLVQQWRKAEKESFREGSVRKSTRPQVASAPLPFGPPPADLATSTISDMDFVRRLENVLLCESRRHGIVVEDQ